MKLIKKTLFRKITDVIPLNYNLNTCYFKDLLSYVFIQIWFGKLKI